MLLVLTLVFLGLFLGAALFLAASLGAGEEIRKTLRRLETIRREAPPAGAEATRAAVRREQPLSALSWFNRLLHRAEPARRLSLLLFQADLAWTVGRLLLTAAVAASVSAYLVYARVRSFWPAVAFGLLAGCTPFGYVTHRRRRRLARIQQFLPEALDLMTGALRAGHSLSAAMGLAARQSPEPLRRELQQCFDEQNFGLDLRTAFGNLAARLPVHEVRVLTTAVLIQTETGGNLTEILEKTAHLIREDFRLRRQVMVHTAQGRLTGWILASLPVILGSALYLVRPDHMRILWNNPVGLKMLYSAAAMTLLGVLMIRKIIGFRI